MPTSTIDGVTEDFLRPARTLSEFFGESLDPVGVGFVVFIGCGALFYIQHDAANQIRETKCRFLKIFPKRQLISIVLSAFSQRFTRRIGPWWAKFFGRQRPDGFSQTWHMK
jgi:hypothetical protein